MGEHHRRREDAPAHHDAAHPGARADLVHDQVGGHFENGVADEEDAGAEGEGRVAEIGVELECLLGKADIGPVEEGQDIH
jgi:hypothetical protein